MKRSAAAASRLEEAGYDNIACVTSGLQSVKPGLFPFSFIFNLLKIRTLNEILMVLVSLGTFESVGSTELQNAGKAGLITIQGKISAVLGTVLVCK